MVHFLTVEKQMLLLSSVVSCRNVLNVANNLRDLITAM